MKRRHYSLNWLSILLWVLVSFVIVNPLRIYLNPILIKNYNIYLADLDHITIIYFGVITTIIALCISLILSYSLKRILQRHLLLAALYILLFTTFLLIFSSTATMLFIALLSFSFGSGLLIVPAVTSVCARIQFLNTIWESEIITKQSSDSLLSYQKQISQKHTIFSSINIIFLLPMSAGIVLLTQSLFIVYIALCILCFICIYILHRHSEFGAFHCKFSLNQLIKNTLFNSMFGAILLILVLVISIDSLVFYLLPYFTYSSYIDLMSLKELHELQVFLFIVSTLIRISMFSFIAISINKLLPRRIIILSCIALSVLIMISQYVNIETKTLLLIIIYLTNSAITPLLLKSLSNFMKLSILPFSLVLVSIIGNYMYGYLHILYKDRLDLIAFFTKKKYSYWYMIIAIFILLLSLIFYINAHRRNLHIVTIEKTNNTTNNIETTNNA